MPVIPRKGTPFSWSTDAQAHPWLVSCDRDGCFYYVCADAEEDGKVKLALHRCPTRGTTHQGLMMARSLLQQAWAELDELVDKIMDPDTAPTEKNDLQQQAKGISTVLAIFMVPHFEFPHEISKEAKRRYEARVAGEQYETAGLGVRMMEPPPSNWRPDVSKASKGVRVADKKTVSLGDKEREAIKFAGSSGMFTHKQLADTYGISEAQVQEIVAG